MPEDAPKMTKPKSPTAAARLQTARATLGQPETKPKLLQGIFAVLLVAIVGFGGGWLGAASRENNQTTTAEAQRVVLDEQSDLISSIAEEVGQSVVSVNVTTQSRSSNIYDFFGMGSGSMEQQSAGTGVIINTEGLIITNRHVVPAGTTSVSVVLSDGTTFDDVEVVGRTNDSDPLDIAFLRVKDTNGKKLVPAKIGTSADMRVGDSVVAIGNALGQLQNTVTTGIISGYGRNVQASDGSGAGTENLDDLFQTDAAINQGNSGGPLVNMSGEVIGINTAVAGDGAENIGFAIPIDNISGLIKSVSSSGKLERPYIGVVYVPLNEDVAKELKLSVTEGAYIPKSADYGRDTVVDGGPADEAGVQEGDVITKVDGVAVTASASLGSLLGRHSPGDTVELTINRDGKTQTIDVTLGTRPTETNS